MTYELDEYREKRNALRRERLAEDGKSLPIEGGGNGPHPPDMTNPESRLARLEGAFDWLKLMLTIIVAVMIGGFAFLGFQVTRTDSKISDLSKDVSALPEKIDTNLRDLTRTLSDAITASKQTPSQIIVVPEPATQLPAQSPAPARRK